jgi:hypothetical protein
MHAYNFKLQKRQAITHKTDNFNEEVIRPTVKIFELTQCKKAYWKRLTLALVVTEQTCQML